MTEATGYSIGVDLSQTPFRYATADADGVALLLAAGTGGSLTGDGVFSDLEIVDHVAGVFGQLAEQRGARPTTIALGFAASDQHRVSSVSEMLADRLGLEPSAVQSLDTQSVQRPVAALAAVLRETRTTPGVIAAGAAGVALGGGAALLAGQSTSAAAAPAVVAGPAGVSLGSTAAAGPSGVPLGTGAATAHSGVSVGATTAAGPSGVSVGTGAVGPKGQPFIGTGPAGKWLKLPVIIGAVVAVVVATVVVVVATRDDPPSTAPRTSDASVVSVSGASPVTLADQTTVVATTEAPTTIAVAATPAGCVVGSWLADNQAYLDAMTAAVIDINIRWESITGALRLDIAADGSVVTTYEGWMMTSTLGGAGTALTSVEGVDTNVVEFGDDGTYTVSATEIGSHMVASSSGFVVVDGLSQDTLFRGTSTYSCDGDRLEVLYHAATDFGATDLLLVFVRSG